MDSGEEGSDGPTMTAGAAAEVAQLNEAARQAQGRAGAARRLAVDIGRRREAMLRRVDGCVARHQPEVWASQAASASRECLQGEVQFGLWAAGESLQQTEGALEVAARGMETAAASYQREAAAVAASDQATLTLSVSSTSPPG